MPKIRFALLGYGHIGKKHASILLAHQEATLVAIADSSFQEDLNAHPKLFNSLENLLENAIEFDVVIIATPNGLHAEHAIACLEHGKHVVIEKPIALSTQAAKEIFAVAEAKQKQVFAVFQNRFSPTSLWLKTLLLNQQLGKIYLVQFNCFWNRDERYYQSNSWHGSKSMDGGTLFTQFSHFIDTLYWFFGGIKNINAKLSNYTNQKTVEFEDTGVITFDFLNGGQGSFQFTTAVWDKNLESTVTVIGEKGTVKIGGQYMENISYCDIKDVLPPNLEKPNESNHQYFIADIIFRLKNNLPAKIEKTEVLAVINVIEEIYNS